MSKMVIRPVIDIPLSWSGLFAWFKWQHPEVKDLSVYSSCSVVGDDFKHFILVTFTNNERFKTSEFTGSDIKKLSLCEIGREVSVVIKGYLNKD